MRKRAIYWPEQGDEALLLHLAKGPFRVASYCDGVPFPGGADLLARLDALVELGLARLVERRGEPNGEWGDVWSVYQITELGLKAADAAR